MKLALAALFVCALSSCVSTTVTPLTSTRYERIAAEDVQIYLSEKDVPGRFEKIALIHAKGDSGWTDQRDMLEKARVDAAELGANGVLLSGIDEASQEAKVAGAIFGVSTKRHGEMVAIRVFYTPRPTAEPQVTATIEQEKVQSFDEWLSEKGDAEE